MDTDHTVSATLGPLLSEADTAGAVAVHGPFRVVRGEWYTLALNLGHGNSRVESGASRGAGIYLNLRQSVEPQRYLGQRRTEFLLRVRANAAADAAAQLSRQLRELGEQGEMAADRRAQMETDLHEARGRLEKLEAAGLVRRQADPDDRRAQRVFSRPKAGRALAALESPADRIALALFAEFSPEELVLFARLSDRLLARLDRLDH